MPQPDNYVHAIFVTCNIGGSQAWTTHIVTPIHITKSYFIYLFFAQNFLKVTGTRVHNSAKLTRLKKDQVTHDFDF